MLDILFPLIGGIGLFLVGMMLFSGGLVAFAGPALQQALARFTGTPRRAFASGALITALAQSSTATTVTLIGFVSAGLIPFAQAIGVVIGASLGNTATGWIVAGLGLKISLGFYTLPLIGIGALLRLLARERWANLGMALAGFGVLFVGLDTLQQGMRGLSDVFSLADLPVGGIGARFFIMLIGIALTAVLQSSTAAIAMTLTALHTEAISFDQATAMVIGASIGTTLTSLLVSIGATVHAKRTAMAHILFNLIAGLFAIALLPLYTFIVNAFATHAELAPGAIVLAAFHTLFIAVGVVLVLPFSERFARFVERLLPERGDVATQHLDSSLLAIPTLALDASQRALDLIAQRLFNCYGTILGGAHPEDLQETLKQTREALDRCFDFVSRIPPPGDEDFATRRIAQLHAIDHLLRFRERLLELDQVRGELDNPVYGEALAQNRQILALALEGFTRSDSDWLEHMAADAAALSALARRIRHGVLQDTGPDSAARALRVTDTFRRLERSGHHVWRVCHYLKTAQKDPARQATDPDPDAEKPLPDPIPSAGNPVAQNPIVLDQPAAAQADPPSGKSAQA
jgi:phosphate:Na+ symporter